MEPCDILVTGGSGFLGQHVIGLLQTRADHVTEIRVLDMVHYENKLDYKHSKPVKTYVGSVTDEKILKEACHGVRCVIHIAGIPDSSMFPDKERINKVNIQGTLLTLLAALGTAGVQRFIYCSSVSVAIGNNDVTDGIREDDPIPSKRLFEPYASSKLAGERFVMAANGPTFRTVCLRPLVMWGELDSTFVQLSLKSAAQTFGYLPRIQCGKIAHHNAYVGNVAWGFVCAEIKLYNDLKRSDVRGSMSNHEKDERNRAEFCSELRRRSKRMGSNLDENEDLKDVNSDLKESTANIYYLVDDTPPNNTYDFLKPFLNASGYKMTEFACPLVLFAIVYWIIFGILFIVRLFGFKVNFPVADGLIGFNKRTYVFNDDKAREELNYRPLYSPEVAFERSIKYYKKCSNNVS
ncbi:3 beta-hydroxysteroid dehydrogenase/Delta 5--_4-isomerase type 1-like [Ruditapes philippinarum]|uniref:3 beta-hydroxysteroid dehydrogenase/Delta 5-->4-isomerase type 1-like n=1 Tax=Ruditapes philippinarum TaxID=129788 RepID=UPI00295A7B98|nr:3 beta-hydroxysteroid dehydrogenase/Delta 5-->4-isomerase type 1-like [Ruditapes philippinarum]